MNKSILDKLLKVGIPIVKPGTIVQLAKTNEDVYIRTAVVYPDSSVIYTGYIFKSENQRQELASLYPTEIKNYDKVLSANLKPVENTEVSQDIDMVKALQDIYTETINTRLSLYNNGVLFSTNGALEKYNNAEEAYRDLLLKLELKTSGGYGYVDGKLILPNDSYIVVYHRSHPTDAFIPVDYITRKIELKPFIKRLFTTLLYGRSHPNNFKYIEDNKSFTSRLLEIIINQQKEKGYIQYNRAEVMI